jgi:hypothetical protein
MSLMRGIGKAFFLCKLNGDGANWQRNSTLRMDVSLRTEDSELMEVGAMYGMGGGGNGRRRDASAA